MTFNDLKLLATEYLNITKQLNKLTTCSINEYLSTQNSLITKKLASTQTSYIKNKLPINKQMEISYLQNKQNQIINQMSAQNYNGFSMFEIDAKLLLAELQTFFATKNLNANFTLSQNLLPLWVNKYQYNFNLQVGNKQYLLQTSKTQPLTLNGKINLPFNNTNFTSGWQALLKRFPNLTKPILNCLESVYNTAHQPRNKNTSTNKTF